MSSIARGVVARKRGVSRATAAYRWLIWTAIAVGPIVLLGLWHSGHMSDPAFGGPVSHFYVVTITSLIVLAFAIMMRVAAGRLNDPRALFLSLAYLGISGVFLVHALTTPGMLASGFNPWIGMSARLALLLGSIMLLVSTIQFSAGLQSAIVRRQRSITVAMVAVIIAYAAIAIASAVFELHVVPNPEAIFNPRFIDTLAWVSLGMLAVVVARYISTYRVAKTPLVVGILVSTIFLAQSTLSMTFAPIWHASWWEYHVLMLAGFSVALASLVREYARSGNLTGVVGGLLLNDTIAQVQRGYTDVIVALIETVEAKDPYTRGHTQRVSELSMLIGQQLGLTSDQLRILNQAAILHDIGKIGIPDAVLNKPGLLTDVEFDLIKEHPARGYQIIRHVRSLRAESLAVRHHHERLDGSGYPDGLVGDQIPLMARIIAVADVFDALTSERPYRRAFSPEKAIEIISSESGEKLDPLCVDALVLTMPVWSGRFVETTSTSRVDTAAVI